MTYRAEVGSVLSPGIGLATPDADFSPQEQSVVLGEGEESTVIDITIFNVRQTKLYHNNLLM